MLTGPKVFSSPRDANAAVLERHDANKSVISSVLVILISIWVGFGFYTLLTIVSGVLTVRGYEPDFLGSMQYGTLKIWLPWVVLSPVVVFLARRFPVQPDNWVHRVLLHMLFLLGLSLLVGSALSYHYHFREEMTEVMKTYLPWQHIGHFLFGDSVFLYNAIIYTLFIATFNIRNFYQLAESHELNSVRLRSQLNEERLRVLRMQVNPHFLFNTLNAINVLVMKGDGAKAGEMINRLGDFFRTTLEDTDEQWVPLAKELDYAQKYLAIEQVRFGDRMRLEESYEDSALSAIVPTMILQPLIENAVRHGVAESEGPCVIRLEAKTSNGRLSVSVQDNGAGCGFESDPGFSEGIGIRNVRQRLTQSYDGDFSFRFTGKSGAGTCISLDLPAWTEAAGR